MVLVLKKEHEKLWDTITEVYKTMLPEDKFTHAKQRFDGFRAGYGTVSSPLFPVHYKNFELTSRDLGPLL